METIQSNQDSSMQNVWNPSKAPAILAFIAGTCSLGFSLVVTTDPDSTDLWLGQYQLPTTIYLIGNSLLLVIAGYLYNSKKFKAFSYISLLLLVSVLISLFIYNSYGTLAIGLSVANSLFMYIFIGGVLIGFHLVSPLFLLSTAVNSVVAFKYLSKK